MNKNKGYFSWHTKMSILLLYVCFFFVQLSYNIDILRFSNTPIIQATIIINNSSQSSKIISKATKPSNKKVNIRLNKRFQPESFLLTGILTSPLRLEFFLSKISFCYTNPTPANAHFISSTLRGPPYVA